MNSPSPAPTAIISCMNLAVGYGSTSAASGITFDVYPGDFVCIVGENGAGKSTLIKTLLRLIPPIDGEFRLDRSSGVGYLPQQTDIQKDFPASVYEIVLSGCQARLGKRPFYGAEEKKRADESMERLKITDLSRRSFRTLSGGQRQRVLLARALCAADSVIMADEPVNGLDPSAAEDMYAALTGLAAGGMAVLTVTHDISAAERLATHILTLGKKVKYERNGDVKWLQ